MTENERIVIVEMVAQTGQPRSNAVDLRGLTLVALVQPPSTPELTLETSVDGGTTFAEVRTSPPSYAAGGEMDYYHAIPAGQLPALRHTRFRMSTTMPAPVPVKFVLRPTS